MNKTFKKLALCAVALLFAQTISAGVKTTYNFVGCIAGLPNLTGSLRQRKQYI